MSIKTHSSFNYLSFKPTTNDVLWLRHTALVSLICLSSLTGCQHMASKEINTSDTVRTSTTSTPNESQSEQDTAIETLFNITGKLGVAIQTAPTLPVDIAAATEQIEVIDPPKTPIQRRPRKPKTASGSAFFAWAQQGNRFAVEMTGALGVGRTMIDYNGSSATLTNPEIGRIRATSPEALLVYATGWYAPISHLPKWILGHPTPVSEFPQYDTYGRLVKDRVQDWQAEFVYADTTSRYPERLILRQGATAADINRNNNRITMILNHQS